MLVPRAAAARHESQSCWVEVLNAQPQATNNQAAPFTDGPRTAQAGGSTEDAPTTEAATAAVIAQAASAEPDNDYETACS